MVGNGMCQNEGGDGGFNASSESIDIIKEKRRERLETPE